MTFDMEPLNCAVDSTTYRIVDGWFGRGVSGKLLYKPPDEVSDVDRISRIDPPNADRRAHLEHGYRRVSGHP